MTFLDEYTALSQLKFRDYECFMVFDDAVCHDLGILILRMSPFTLLAYHGGDDRMKPIIHDVQDDLDDPAISSADIRSTSGVVLLILFQLHFIPTPTLPAKKSHC